MKIEGLTMMMRQHERIKYVAVHQTDDEQAHKALRKLDYRITGIEEFNQFLSGYGLVIKTIDQLKDMQDAYDNQEAEKERLKNLELEINKKIELAQAAVDEAKRKRGYIPTAELEKQVEQLSSPAPEPTPTSMGEAVADVGEAHDDFSDILDSNAKPKKHLW